MVSETRPSGLLVARESSDERSMTSTVKRTFPGYALQKRRRHESDPSDVTEVYKIVHVESGHVAFTWMDDHGRPLPLSSGLVDAFQSLMLGGRNTRISEDEWNARLVAEKKRDADRDEENILDDHAPYLFRDRTQVAFTGTKKPRYWMRENTRPKGKR
jgi:hypothetical protein